MKNITCIKKKYYLKILTFSRTVSLKMVRYGFSIGIKVIIFLLVLGSVGFV